MPKIPIIISTACKYFYFYSKLNYMAKTDYQSIDETFGLPEEVKRIRLETLRQIVRKRHRQLQSNHYQIPAFKIGKYFFGVLCWLLLNT